VSVPYDNVTVTGRSHGELGASREAIQFAVAATTRSALGSDEMRSVMSDKKNAPRKPKRLASVVNRIE